MGSLGLELWVLIAGVIAGGIVCMLYTLSATLRDYRRAHQLRMEVESLRRKHSERLAAMKLRAEMDAVSRRAA